MQSETGFPSSHQLKSYVAHKSRPAWNWRCALSCHRMLAFLLAIFSLRMCRNAHLWTSG